MLHYPIETESLHDRAPFEWPYGCLNYTYGWLFDCIRLGSLREKIRMVLVKAYDRQAFSRYPR